MGADTNKVPRDTNSDAPHDSKLMSLGAAHAAVPAAVRKPRKVADSEGLHILLQPSGSMLWRLAYRFNDKQNVLALGRYPDVPLAKARKAAVDARALIADGHDPAVERKRAKVRAKTAAMDSTFKVVAEAWFKARKVKWVKSYADGLRSRLDNDLLPDLGALKIAAIEAAEILDCIRKIEQRGAPEMARRVLQMAGNIFRFGVATGQCARNPAGDVRDALASPNPVKHRSSLKPGDLPEFMQDAAAARISAEVIHSLLAEQQLLRLTQDGAAKSPKDRPRIPTVPGRIPRGVLDDRQLAAGDRLVDGAAVREAAIQVRRRHAELARHVSDGRRLEAEISAARRRGSMGSKGTMSCFTGLRSRRVGRSDLHG